MEKSMKVIVNLPDGSIEEQEVVIWEHEGELQIRRTIINNE